MSWSLVAEPPEHHSSEQLAALDGVIQGWLDTQAAENPAVDAVERALDEPHRWFVRIFGDDKEAWTLRLWLRPRTLYYETYLAPAPRFNVEEVYRYVLRKNIDRYGVSVAVGAEDGIFLVGQLPNGLVGSEELDRILGTVYQATEELFRPVISLGFDTSR